MADVLVAMSQSSYDIYIKGVSLKDGIVIYDEQLVSTKKINNLKQIGVPATGTAIKELNNRQVANIVMLGAVVGITKTVTWDALTSAIEENIPERFKALNLKAVKLGFKLGSEAIKIK